MNMTKRDVADIAAVWMTVAFITAFVQAVITIGVYIGMTDEFMQHTNRSTAILFQLIAVFILGLVNYALLFKREHLLGIVFPNSSDKEVSVPDGLSILTSYGFWIRLFGIFTFLSSGTQLIGRLAIDLSINSFNYAGKFWMHGSGALFVSTVLAALIIWKADWIANILGKQNKIVQHAPPAGRGEAPRP